MLCMLRVLSSTLVKFSRTILIIVVKNFAFFFFSYTKKKNVYWLAGKEIPPGVSFTILKKKKTKQGSAIQQRVKENLINYLFNY